jgi:hypothetical protein
MSDGGAHARAGGTRPAGLIDQAGGLIMLG